MNTRVYIAEDHPIVCEGIAAVISRIEGCFVCGTGGALTQVSLDLEQLKPDLLILDLLLDGHLSLNLIKHLTQYQPETKILVLSMMDETAYPVRVLHAGARGFVMKSEATLELKLAVQTVLRGERFLSTDLSKSMALRVTRDAKGEQIAQLSDRQLEVLSLMVDGLKNKEIAVRMNLSSRTIETHKQNIRNKLDCQTMEELYVRAVEWFAGKRAFSSSPGIDNGSSSL